MDVKENQASTSSTTILKFAPWGSNVNEGFWKRLADLKLDTLRVSETSIEITGFYAPVSQGQISNHLMLLSESLPADSDLQSAKPVKFSSSGNRNLCPVPGILYNTNTLNNFKELDRNALFRSEVDKIWEDINSGRAENEPNLLCRFLLISFADLKKWGFYYWFAFPALVMDPPAKLVSLKLASEFFNAQEGTSLLQACKEWRQSLSTTGVVFFLVHLMSPMNVRVRPLQDWSTCCQEGGKVLLGFYDPCHLSSAPGWPLRNFLALAVARWNLKTVSVLCYRERRGFGDLQQCLVLDIELPSQTNWSNNAGSPNAFGWEPNDQRKMAPRYINLAKHMDPKKVAVSAADLNLKLMRWRALPSLDTERLASTRCLLLGAGTLGCQVARGLLAWGIRKITFVDAGRVSMSNPLRQSLYNYEDCLNGGQLKATAAAKSLETIFPGSESNAVNMTIPMPGHLVSQEELPNVRNDCMQLKDLVDNHDFVFLLTDTRESRWLPTLLCAESNKVAITAALGFNTFVVMRHGANKDPQGSIQTETDIANSKSNNTEHDRSEKVTKELKKKEEKLGCYFCNDIIAPNNSTQNLTLDQQCTVTRPGLAPIAAALAVEMAVGIIHHSLGVNAPADNAVADDFNFDEQPLGILPHQIRGDFSRFSQLILKGYASGRCVACSDMIVSEYRNRGMEFLLEVISYPTYLEDITGFAKLAISDNDWAQDGLSGEDDFEI